MPLEPLAAICR